MIAGILAGAGLIGLALFAVLVRNAPAPLYFRLLGPGVVLLVLSGLALLRLLPPESAEPQRLALALGLLWLGWVGLLAYMVQAVRLRLPQSGTILAAGGGLATLAPVAGCLLALYLL